MVGVSSILGTNLVTMALYVIAAISGWVGPLLTPKIGHRGIGIAGFGIVFVSLLVAAAALHTGNKAVLPFAAAAMLSVHYWDASNCMTIPALVAKPEYRGTASGFAYMFVKLPSFLAIFLFPSVFAAIGQANATLLVAIFPLIGLLAAIFILPEVYGFEHDAGSRARVVDRPDGQTDLRVEHHQVDAAVGENCRGRRPSPAPRARRAPAESPRRCRTRGARRDALPPDSTGSPTAPSLTSIAAQARKCLGDRDVLGKSNRR